jgi:hypothetical protein
MSYQLHNTEIIVSSELGDERRRGGEEGKVVTHSNCRTGAIRHSKINGTTNRPELQRKATHGLLYPSTAATGQWEDG